MDNEELDRVVMECKERFGDSWWIIPLLFLPIFHKVDPETLEKFKQENGKGR